MKNGLPLLALGTLLLVTPKANPQRAAVVHPARTQADRIPVLVELFTSEGCSTCPPADAALAGLEDEQPVNGAEIVAFEEHVDYWNQQGWTDPFSSAEWTLRQQDYAATLKVDGVYTPQMIVDGQQQFIGSRIREATAAIAEAAQRTKTDISLARETSAANGAIQLTVRVGRLTRDTDRDAAVVWLAVIEKDLNSAVSRGENAGKTLRHAAVLRTLQKLGVAQGKDQSCSFAGNPNVKPKSTWKQSNLRVVVFVQEKKSRRILGIASTTVGN